MLRRHTATPLHAYAQRHAQQRHVICRAPCLCQWRRLLRQRAPRSMPNMPLLLAETPSARVPKRHAAMLRASARVMLPRVATASVTRVSYCQPPRSTGRLRRCHSQCRTGYYAQRRDDTLKANRYAVRRATLPRYAGAAVCRHCLPRHALLLPPRRRGHAPC